MAGLYIHIPFCASRCIYCSFYSTTRLDLRQQYVDAVCREMGMRMLPSAFATDPPTISTVYLGGGTPSQLTVAQLHQLFDTLYIYKVEQNAEITIEMNPDDVTPQYAAALTGLGINRVSMGAQTFDDQRLRFLHRRHTAAQVSEAVCILRNAGIRNISIDLMYGFPGETIDDWQRDIDAVLALDVEHLSAYCLMVEEGTALYRMMNKGGDFLMCDEETERTMYEQLTDRLTAVGYEHYEISNFARPDYRSRHNSSYWHDMPYIGLGAAAHSYDGVCRSWNVSDICSYINAVNHGELPSEGETLDDDTRYNDRIATALRTSDGLDLATLTDRHRQYCIQEAQPFIKDELLSLTDNRLVLTRRGIFVSDMVMSALVWA